MAVDGIGTALGCQQDKTPADTATGDTEVIEEPAPPQSPSPYEYEGGDELPAYDRVALETALNDLLSTVLLISGDAPIAGYESMLAAADEYCPIWYETEGSVYWVGGCTSTSGSRFEGYVFSESYVDQPAMGEDSSMTGTSINGQATVTAADGTRLDIAGYTYSAAGTIENGEAWMTAVVGSFEWTDEAAEESWLGGPIQPNLETVAYRWDYGTIDRGVVISGGLTGFSDTWGTAYLDNVMAITELGGYWPCPEETNGIVSIRDPTGYWFQIVFDIEPVGDGFTMPPGTCDGCGTVYLNGEVVGEACTDFNALLEWGDEPW